MSDKGLGIRCPEHGGLLRTPAGEGARDPDCCERDPPAGCFLLSPCWPYQDHNCTKYGNCCFSDECCLSVSVNASNLVNTHDPQDGDCCIAHGWVTGAAGTGGSNDCDGPSYSGWGSGSICADCPGDYDEDYGTGAILSVSYGDHFGVGSSAWEVFGMGDDSTEAWYAAYGRGSSSCCPSGEQITLSQYGVSWSGTVTVTITLSNNDCCKDDNGWCQETEGENTCPGGEMMDCDDDLSGRCPLGAPDVKVRNALGDYLGPADGGTGTGVISVDGKCYKIAPADDCDGAVTLSAGIVAGITEYSACWECCDT